MKLHYTREEARALFQKIRPAKYRANGHYDADGVYWHSDREEARWQELKLLERTGQIKNLERQVRLPLHYENTKITSYLADFIYEDRRGIHVIEDAKGLRLAMYKIKKKWVEAQYGIVIQEV